MKKAGDRFLCWYNRAGGAGGMLDGEEAQVRSSVLVVLSFYRERFRRSTCMVRP